MALYDSGGKFLGTQPQAAQSGGLYDPSGKFQPTPVATPPSAPSPQPSGKGALWDAAGGLIKGLTNSEQEFGKDLSTIGSNAPAEANDINAKANVSRDALLTAIHNQPDPAMKQHLLDAYVKIHGNDAPVTAGDINPAFNKTPGQVVGDAAGVALDAASAGTYGNAAKGAETGKLLATGAKTVAPVIADAAKTTVGSTLKDIGVKTAGRSAVGAATGYGYDVSQNLQNGKEGTAAFAPGMGTALGAAIPLGIGGIEAGAAITKGMAPRFINSLIKPNAASFAYGKDPGRTVSALGITGNNLSDFADNIEKAKNDVGSKIGDIISKPGNENIHIDANPTIAKLDDAMASAAKGGKNNQGIVTTLQNIKDSLLYEHTTDKDGNIVKVLDTNSQAIPRDLANLTPEETFNLKKEIAAQTKFTGKPSDDKTVNAILKSMYGDLKEKLNGSLSPTSPEIADLNQKYADLTSAELATRNRDAIVQRSNMVSMPVKVGTAAGIITALGSGGAAIPAIMAGATAAALDKAMGSTAVRSRVAAWLGSETPGVIQQVLQNNPAIKAVLYRALPKFASQLGLPTQ